MSESLTSRCESISPAIVACQCRLEVGHDGDHMNDIYGVFWPRCARDSDWCDGRICKERGIECWNAQSRRDGLLVASKPSLRAWRPMPIVDAVGRPLDASSTVQFRRTRQMRQRENLPRPIIFLFTYEDEAPPQIEIAGDIGIITLTAELRGDCWKFETLLLAVEYRYYLGTKVEPLGQSLWRRSLTATGYEVAQDHLVTGPWRWARWPDGRRFLHWEDQLRREPWG